MEWKLLTDKKELAPAMDHWIPIIQSELGNFDGYIALYWDFINKGVFKVFESVDKKAMFAFMIYNDFRGGYTLLELFMYVKPEYRGSVSLFKDMIHTVEKYAKEQGCSSVEIGGNAGYREDKVLQILCRAFGYNNYSVKKEL